MPFPFAARMPRSLLSSLDSSRTARRARAGLLFFGRCVIFHSFPVADHYMQPIGRILPTTPLTRPLSRLHFERRACPRGLTLPGVYERPPHICFTFYCPRYYLKRFQVARQSARAVTSYEWRIISMVKRRAEMTRVYHVTLSECMPPRREPLQLRICHVNRVRSVNAGGWLCIYYPYTI